MDEVYVSDRKDPNRIPDPWDRDFMPMDSSELDKILDFKDGIQNFAGALARSNFINEEERIAYLQLIFNAESIGKTEMIDGKNGMEDELKLILNSLASTLGRKGLGRTLQLQIHTGIVMPGFMESLLGLGKSKTKEKGIKRSDFKERDEERRQDGVS